MITNTHLYTADGTLRCALRGTKRTDYIDNAIYESGAFKRILVDGGYIEDGHYYYYFKNHLGSNRVVGSNRWPEIIQLNHYYPYGTPFAKGLASMEQPFKYVGKEYDTENGLNLYDFEARQLDTNVGFMSIDPLTEKYPSISPYAYCKGNPLKYIDPTGASASPIYDREGELLGTDNQGLQGDAIVMDEKDFKQSMDHEEAKKKDLGEDGFVSGKAYAKYHKSYNSLPNRPDYDGYLTLAEANEWYRNGSKDPLFVDLSKIDMSNLYSLGEKYVGERKSISLFKASASINDALVYGSFVMTRYPNHQVRASFDRYDFEMHKGRSITTWARNQATKIGAWVAGYGRPYEVYFYGSKTLKHLYPWIK